MSRRALRSSERISVWLESIDEAVDHLVPGLSRASPDLLFLLKAALNTRTPPNRPHHPYQVLLGLVPTRQPHGNTFIDVANHWN